MTLKKGCVFDYLALVCIMMLLTATRAKNCRIPSSALLGSVLRLSGGARGVQIEGAEPLVEPGDHLWVDILYVELPHVTHAPQVFVTLVVGLVEWHLAGFLGYNNRLFSEYIHVLSDWRIIRKHTEIHDKSNLIDRNK